MAMGLTQPVTGMGTRNIYWGGMKAAGAWGTQLTTFVGGLSGNLGDTTSSNFQGLARPVMGLLYLTLQLLM